MRPRRLVAMVVGLITAAALTLTGCSSQYSDKNTGSSGHTSDVTDDFPLTIRHALGETTIQEPPERVATWGWGSTEAAIAVGVYPVAVAEQTWTVGKGNLLPWVKDAYMKADIPLPAVLTDVNNGTTVPYEEFIAADPDLIIATYSGLTQEQYDLLSEFAPVVAYPEEPWKTPWDETITLTAESLGRSASGDRVLATIDEYLAGLRAEHPEFEGTTIAAISDYPEKNFVYVYNSSDARADFLKRLGFTTAPAVDELDTTGGEQFSYTLSYEELDKLESDVVVNFAKDEKTAQEVLHRKELQAIPAVRDGKLVQLVGTVPVSSAGPPNALSYKYPEGVPALVESLAKALTP